MKHEESYFFCSQKLLKNVDEVNEVFLCIEAIEWMPDFEIESNGSKVMHQAAYNKAFEIEFLKHNWETKPLLHDNPKLIGDFQKNDVFVEIQFGNSATIYRDYYKFHYGLTKKLLSLAVLIVPLQPTKFFPNRPKSVSNMAEFEFAQRYFELLSIPVPILLIGLKPEN